MVSVPSILTLQVPEKSFHFLRIPNISKPPCKIFQAKKTLKLNRAEKLEMDGTPNYGLGLSIVGGFNPSEKY